MTESDKIAKKARRKTRVPLSVLLDTLKKLRGNVTLASEKLGTSRETIYKRVGAETIQAIREDADLWRIDIAMGQLDKALVSGERWAIEKQLEKMGYARQAILTGELSVKIIELPPEES